MRYLWLLYVFLRFRWSFRNNSSFPCFPGACIYLSTDCLDYLPKKKKKLIAWIVTGAHLLLGFLHQMAAAVFSVGLQAQLDLVLAGLNPGLNSRRANSDSTLT